MGRNSGHSTGDLISSSFTLNSMCGDIFVCEEAINLCRKRHDVVCVLDKTQFHCYKYYKMISNDFPFIISNFNLYFNYIFLGPNSLAWFPFLIICGLFIFFLGSKPIGKVDFI